MKKFLLFLVVLAVGGYVGVTFLMESLTYTSLPGQVSRAVAFTLWDAVAQGAQGNVSLPMDEVNKAIDFNPKIRLLAFEGEARQTSAAEADALVIKGGEVYRVNWLQPLQKGETLIYLTADVTFRVESTCVPFLRHTRSFAMQTVTNCPVRSALPARRP
ncbi:MAG: hypothetical protein JXR77_11020 [Lentisphaeria bacterium]|nr:hypothetical protein [Lentisphaeria bacterium]